MGTLVAMRYPTPLALWLADHTYVKCSNDGKAWGCWGGKTGGTELRRADGSTLRADAIAGHDEKAGIRCYLVNGVCHQAANRILMPANIIVMGAAGYRLSEARFGVYGRPRGRGLFRWCVAPFNQYPHVKGDLPECLDAAGPTAMRTPGSPDYPSGAAAAQPEGAFLAAVQRLYGGRTAILDSTMQLQGPSLVEFMVAQFDLRLEFTPGLENAKRGALRDIRVDTERQQIELEEAVGEGRLAMRDFPMASDDLTRRMQLRMQEPLGEAGFNALFEADYGKPRGLADPEIAGPIYGVR